MDSDVVLWIARGIIIGMALVMAIYVFRWRRQGVIWERFHIYFLVLGITTLIVGNFVLTMSLVNGLSAFYGTYIGACGVVSLIIWLLVRRFTSRDR